MFLFPAMRRTDFTIGLEMRGKDTLQVTFDGGGKPSKTVTFRGPLNLSEAVKRGELTDEEARQLDACFDQLMHADDIPTGIPVTPEMLMPRTEEEARRAWTGR